MTKVLLITPDRNDRAELLNHCRWQVNRLAGNFEHLIVNFEPVSAQHDIRERVKFGVDYALSNGFEWCSVLENDDFYAHHYLHTVCKLMDGADFIGSEFTYYHNLKNRTWERSHHPNHSSLFCTSFRASVMKDFKWHQAHRTFLDLDIWRYARRFRRTFTDLPAIGIKHGIGMTGGKGHSQTFPNKDGDLSWLKSKVDDVSYEFYSTLKV